ncbi:inositol monophosphatase family protein [Opitutaceae bacterium]
MPSPELLARSEAARAAVLAQAELFHREFGRAKSAWKSDGTRVTAVDFAISENIYAELRVHFPEDQFFSEELTDAPAPLPVTARFSWVLDPIDGTNNYAMGIAHCAISLALLENGQPVYGVVYDLARRSLMHGGPGFGLFDGERTARVRTEAPCAQSMIGFHSPMDKRHSGDAERIVREFKIRSLGSSTLHLAYVAVGILDGTIDHNVKIWDIAAAIPLVLAGGGQVEFITPSPIPLRTFDLKMGRIFYLAGSPVMCAHIRKILGQ